MGQVFQIPQVKVGPFVHGADSERGAGVPEGRVMKREWKSAIFPGTFRSYWIYVPAQYKAGEAAALMVFQDGASYVEEKGEMRAPVVFDHLIARGEMPVTIGLFIDPGQFPRVKPEGSDISNRSFEYDTLSDQYTRFLLEEMIPEVEKEYALKDDAEARAICGCSSGGICAFTVAWERPDKFRKVLSHVGSFANIRGGHVYPTLVRKTAAKPVRVFLQAGSNDLDRDWGHWGLANLEMAAALAFKGYDYRLEYGDGAHDRKHGGAILPESLRWLWRK